MIEQSVFGNMSDGTAVRLFRLSSSVTPVTFSVMTIGATLTDLRVPDRQGRMTRIVWGYDSAEDYLEKRGYYGAFVGRVANRIGGASFELDGVTYRVTANEGKNTLHGGEGYSYKLFTPTVLSEGDEPAVKMTVVSPDGDDGFPGRATVCATYRLLKDGTVELVMEGSTDKPTVMNLTGHSFFNLGGIGSGTVDTHLLTVQSDRFAVIDEHLLPTGEMRPVDGTPFDFCTEKRIGDGINAPDEQLRLAGGYDHCFFLEKGSSIREAAVLASAETGIRMTLATDHRGLQVYSGNFMDPTVGLMGGYLPIRRGAVCLEPESLPDAVHWPQIDSIRLDPQDHYCKTIRYSFTTVA